MSEGPRFFGKYRASVINNVDPQLQGRIQVQLGDRYGLFPSTWAAPCVPLAGPNAGIIALPPVGSQVWVEFEAGDPDYPIWSGGFWPQPGMVPVLAMAGPSPITPNIHLQTTSGVMLTMSDNPAAQLMITTPTGASIVIGAAGIVISNGQGASIALAGPSVTVNAGALVVT